jgi:hypothetical protein
MATRLQQTIFDANQQDWTILIDDADFSGSATDIDITSAKIQWQASSSERFAAVMPSVADVSFRIDGASLQTFVTDYIAAAEQRFKLVVYKGVDLFWVGNIQTDNVRRQDKEWPYIFQIRATDGLAALKDIDYNDAGTAYTGLERCTEHVINALNKIGTASLFGTDFLKTGVRWFSADHTSTSLDPLHESRFNHRRFVKVDSSDNTTFSSCYDVLETICKAFGARIYLSDGSFYITQINEYEGNTLLYYNYNSSKAASGSDTSTTYQVTDGTDVIRLGGGAYQYYPALRQVDVVYKHLQAQSLIPPFAISNVDYTVGEIDSGNGTSPLLISFKVKYSIVKAIGEDFQPVRMGFRLKIRVGPNYLVRDSRSFPVSYTTPEWQGSAGWYEIITPIITENNTSQFLTVQFLTPPVPADGTMIISGEYETTHTLSGPPYTPSSQSISFYDCYIENVPSGFVESRSNQITYKTENDATDNSKRISTEVELGDGPSFNALGALQVYDGSDWVKSSGWEVEGTAGTDEIGQLLAQEILKTQSKPVEIIGSTYHGSITPKYTVVKDSIDHAVRQATMDLVAGTTQGLFFQCDSTGAAFTDKDAEPAFDIDEELSPITPINTPIEKNPQPEAQTDPTLQTTFAKRRVFTTDGAISEGSTVTSIQIAASGVDDLIKTNDRFDIIDAITGNSQTFVATADVAGTDTSISVTSDTADFDFSNGSIISFSQDQIIEKINDVSTGGAVSSVSGGEGITVDTTTGNVTASLELSELTNLINPSGADYIAGYRQSTGASVTWQLFDLVSTILDSPDASVTITTDGANVDLSVNFPIESVTVGSGLDISGTTTRNITLNFTELLTSSGFDYNDYLAGHTSAGTMARTNVLDMFANMITAGTNVTVSNTGTAIQISATGSSGVTSITGGTGINPDTASTGAVTLSLDLSELTLTSAVGGEFFVVGTDASGNERRFTIQNLLLDSLIAGSGVTIAASGNDVEISASGSSYSWTVRADDLNTNQITSGEILDINGGNGLETRINFGDVDILLDGDSLINLGTSIDKAYQAWVFSGVIKGRATIGQIVAEPISSLIGTIDVVKSGNDVYLDVNRETATASGLTNGSGQFTISHTMGIGCIPIITPRNALLYVVTSVTSTTVTITAYTVSGGAFTAAASTIYNVYYYFPI